MHERLKILILDSEPENQRLLVALLGVFNEVRASADLIAAHRSVRDRGYDAIITDHPLPNERTDLRGAVVIDSTLLTSPEQILHRLPAALTSEALRRCDPALAERVREAFRYELIGSSASTNEIRETVLGLAGTGATTLITGESGTGKELIARRLHAVEGDPRRPFIAVNCGAIAENLIESELFGHKKGSFTGAFVDRAGKIELADGGDLFLDEVGELPMLAQTKLLRALQEGEVTRVGEHRVMRVRCRFIAATNQNLERLVREKKFREDLYHRLNVVRIETTPLRERPEDIAELALLFTDQLSEGKLRLQPVTMARLRVSGWPGNIRELRNTIERAVISARRRKAGEIEPQDLGARTVARVENTNGALALPASPEEVSPEGFRKFLEETQKNYLAAALTLSGGSAEALAHKLGLGRSTVFKRLRDLGLGGSARSPRRAPSDTPA